MLERKSSPLTLYLLALSFVVALAELGFGIQRHETLYLLAAYIVAFACYIFFLNISITKNRLQLLVYLGIAARILMVFSFPTLSDDIFRFIWDGNLIQAGINPFSQTPEVFLASGAPVPGNNSVLLGLLNSPGYYTVYPPFAQFIFWLSTTVNTWYGSATVMGLIILLAEVGNIFVIKKLLGIYRIHSKHVLIYALNPLVIVELTGNLHFEAFMIFFLLLGIYLLHQNKAYLAGVMYGIAIASKLLPLMFLPLFIRRIKLRALLVFYAMIGLSSLLLFAPFLSEAFNIGMSSSLSLYFQKFEFNASLYYLFREIGFWFVGYNTIGFLGKVLPVATLLIILFLASRKPSSNRNILEMMMWIFFIYLAFATTIHPWYIVPVLALSVFSTYKFPIIWSFFVFFTYAGYTVSGFSENLAVVVVEYSVVFSVALYELFQSYKNEFKTVENVT